MDADQRWTAWVRWRGEWKSEAFLDGSMRQAFALARLSVEMFGMAPANFRVVSPSGDIFVYDIEAML